MTFQRKPAGAVPRRLRRINWPILVLAWSLAACQVSGTPATPTALPTSAATRVAVATTATAAPLPPSFAALCREAEEPGEWYSRLVFRGRTYARVVAIAPRQGTPVTEPPFPPTFELGEEVGRVFAPWQAASTADTRWHAPPGSPIRAVRGIPPEAMLAVTYQIDNIHAVGAATDLFCATGDPSPLSTTRVVRGRVERDLPVPYCEFRRCGDVRRLNPDYVLATVEVAVREVWQGTPPGDDQPLTVVTLLAFPSTERPGRFVPGDEVVLLVRPQEALEDFMPPAISGAPTSNRRPIWVAERVGQYRVEGEVLRWLGDDTTTIPVATFRAGLTETFAGVTPSDPPMPSTRP